MATLSLAIHLIDDSSPVYRYCASVSSLVHSALVDAARHFRADAHKHAIATRDNKGNTKIVPASLQLRHTALKHNAKLYLIPCSARSRVVDVSILCDGGHTLKGAYDVDTTLDKILEDQQNSHPELKITTWHGIPPSPAPSSSSPSSLVISYSRPGTNTPVIELAGHKYANGDLSSSLFDLGLHSDGPVCSRVRLRLFHAYAADPVSEEESKNIINNFNEKFQQAIQQQQQRQPMEVDPTSPLSPSHSSPSPAPLPSIPADRAARLFFAKSGRLASPELPDEFFDITEEDSKLYAKSLLQSKPLVGALKALEPAAAVKARKIYTQTRIRIRMPFHLYIEGLFYSTDTVADVRQFVRSFLADPDIPFYLFISPPKQRLGSGAAKLGPLGLAPSAIVNFAVDVPAAEHIAALKAASSGAADEAARSPAAAADDGQSNASEVAERAQASPFYALSPPEGRPGTGIIKAEFLDSIAIIEPAPATAPVAGDAATVVSEDDALAAAIMKKLEEDADLAPLLAPPSSVSVICASRVLTVCGCVSIASIERLMAFVGRHAEGATVQSRLTINMDNK